MNTLMDIAGASLKILRKGLQRMTLAATVCLPFSAYAESYFSADMAGAVTSYDQATNQVISSTSFSSRPYALEESPDGNTLYVLVNGNELTALPVPSGPASSLLSLSNRASDITISPDSHTLYLVGEASTQLTVVDAATLTVTHTYTIPVSIGAKGAISPDGSTLYLPTLSGIAVINTATGATVTTITTNGSAFAVELTPDGLHLYALQSSAPKAIEVYDTTTNALSTQITDARFDFLYKQRMRPDGQYLYVIDQSNNIFTISTTSNLVTSDFQPNSEKFDYEFEFSPDSSRMYVQQVASPGSNIIVVDTATHQIVSTIAEPAGGDLIATRPVFTPPAHTLKFYLHGSDIPGTATGYTMNQTPAASGSSVVLNLLAAPAWFSNPALTGTFAAGTAFQLDVPCSVGLGVVVTYTLQKTSLTGGSATTVGSTSQLLDSCLGTTHMISIPVTGPVTFANQRLKLTISSLLGLFLALPLGDGTYLQGTQFTGTP